MVIDSILDDIDKYKKQLHNKTKRKKYLMWINYNVENYLVEVVSTNEGFIKKNLIEYNAERLECLSRYEKKSGANKDIKIYILKSQERVMRELAEVEKEALNIFYKKLLELEKLMGEIGKNNFYESKYNNGRNKSCFNKDFEKVKKIIKLIEEASGKKSFKETVSKLKFPMFN